MRDKKKAASDKTPEQEELEKHVDAMMDPKKSEPEISAVNIPVNGAPTTAPQLPKPGKKITITEASSKPLSIDKLDELTKSITESDKPKKPKKSKDKAKAQDEPKVPEKPEPPETPEPAETDEPKIETDITENSMELDDAQTDKAVDDIVAYEGDVMLAVADSTAEAHNREFAEAEPEDHHLFSTFMWALVTFAVILILALGCLLVMGSSLTDKLGL